MAFTVDPSLFELESHNRWMEYSQVKDAMFARTNIPEAPWFTIEANDKNVVLMLRRDRFLVRQGRGEHRDEISPRTKCALALVESSLAP